MDDHDSPSTVRTGPAGDTGPDGDVAAPTRRRVLGLLATAGAAAVAVPLTGSRSASSASPNRLDPGAVLQLSVCAVLRGVDLTARSGHGGHEPATDRSADGGVWARLVTVDLFVRNTADRAVLFSPGQVRLRLLDGTGVMPAESERPAGKVPARTTVRTWVRFLAPFDDAEILIDYTPAGARRSVALPLPDAAHEHEHAR